MNVSSFRKRLKQYPYANTILNDQLGTMMLQHHDMASKDSNGNHALGFLRLGVMAYRDLCEDGITNENLPCNVSVADMIRILEDIPQNIELFDNKLARNFYSAFAEVLEDNTVLPKRYRERAKECASFIAEVLDFEDYEMGFDHDSFDLGLDSEFSDGDDDDDGGGGSLI